MKLFKQELTYTRDEYNNHITRYKELSERVIISELLHDIIGNMNEVDLYKLKELINFDKTSDAYDPEKKSFRIILIL